MFREKWTDGDGDNDEELQVVSYPKPDLTALVLKHEIKKLRAADRQRKLNEYFGGHEIFRLSIDERQTQRKTLCTQVMEVLYRGFSGTIQLFMPGVNELEKEMKLGEIERKDAPKYCFDLGPYVRFYPKAAIVIAPGFGHIRTSKVETAEGTKVDVMEVEIPDPNILGNAFEKINQVQAQILTPKLASVIWIFAERVSCVLVSESNPEIKWTPVQWYRKVLSDLAMTELQVLEHPTFWDRSIHAKIVRARTQFKEIYRRIGGTSEFLAEPEPLNSDEQPDFESQYYLIKKYEVVGGTRYKIWEQFPYTDTRIVIGNYFPDKEEEEQPIEEIVKVLFGDLNIYSDEIVESDGLSHHTIGEGDEIGEERSEVKITDENENRDDVSDASSGPVVESIKYAKKIENVDEGQQESLNPKSLDDEVADRESEMVEYYRAGLTPLSTFWGHQPRSPRVYTASPKWNSVAKDGIDQC